MFTKNILLAGTSCGQLRKGVSKFPSIISKYIRPSYNTYDMELKNEIYHDMNMIYKTGMPHDKFICIGGDHSISIATGALSLNRHPDTKFIWIDAHADINTFSSSITKNYHGMPLSFLTKLDCNHHFQFINKRLKFENLCYIGLRDIDRFEREVINDNKIKCIDHKIDIVLILDNLSRFIKDSPIHISFDVDSIDPTYISSTGTKVNNGITVYKAKLLLQYLLAKNVVGMDIVEMNMDIDKDKYETSMKNFKWLLSDILI